MLLDFIMQICIIIDNEYRILQMNLCILTIGVSLYKPDPSVKILGYINKKEGVVL